MIDAIDFFVREEEAYEFEDRSDQRGRNRSGDRDRSHEGSE